MFKNKRSSSTAVFIIFLLMLTASRSNAQSDKRSVLTQTTIENGTIEGIDDSGIAIYKGIPFAQPPVGDLRWKPPANPEDWQGVREAKTFGPGCMQLPVFSDMNFRSEGFSEDCLYLNVWTPAKSVDKNLPVLVYFYGGGFMAGDGSEPRYGGGSMARNHGIVTVTVNYRLGVFGFMSHPELTAESPHNASGNYGLLDQAKALQWVKDNISAFGGNPNDITIAGESAGSISVSAQMASPLSRDLIAGAIGESGSIMGALPAVPLEEAENTGQQFADFIDVQSLSELRAIDADTLLEHTGKQQAPQFSPTVDGYFFPKAPVEIYADAEQANVPLFIGWNSQEMNYQFIMQGNEPTPDNYAQKVKELYGEDADKILKLYPASTTEEAVYSATDLASDRFIGYSTWKWSDIHSETGTQSVYRYYYTHPRPPMAKEQGQDQNNGEEGNNDFPEPKGAAHAVEIEYLMGNLPSNNVFAWTEEDYKVSDIFQNYAANFIKNKNPNGLGVPYWSALNEGDTPKVIYIGPETQLKEEQHRERYLLLDELYYQDQN
ncbi:carboxylesterase family protein [Aliifodinibius salicampi]|uniref:Carboxylic ester hydrolase n=1 Tax=Fodinibius salicampi TaxID=1920655 RepID=A0ABT3PYM7_9BACT|nr:carboxylesterase family protein [Fodinibius salicampi]MCW9712948.1 carboxylesterase family protein [Fodinibius salicampi]